MIKKKLILFTLFLLVGVALAQGAVAVGESVPTLFGGGIPTGVTSGGEFIELLVVITDWVFVIVLVFAIIFIVLAGFQFITGGGDPSAVSQARNKLLWAAVGIAVAVLARGIPTAVRSIIGAP